MKKSTNILLLMCLLVMVFASNAWCSGFSIDSYDFGWKLAGTNICTTNIFWTNDAGGGTYCDRTGCWQTPLPTVTATFTAPGFSVTPNTAVVPGYGTVGLNVCSSPAVGDYSRDLTGTDGTYYFTVHLHVLGIPSLVTCEPLGSTLSFGAVAVGTTASKSFNVCNYNSSAVTINTITVDNSNFIVISGYNPVIPAVKDQYTPSCQSVTIKFAPQTTGNFNANIQVNTTAQNLIYTASGTGPPFYTVTPSAGVNGSISPNTPQIVSLNNTTTFTVTPNIGYYASVTGCGGTLSGNTYTTGPITDNCTVSATFVSDFIVTPSAGANGSINPNTAQWVAPNGTTSFTVAPNTGYVIASVTGCGGTLSGNTYMTGSITSNCTVSATFTALPSYTISEVVPKNRTVV